MSQTTSSDQDQLEALIRRVVREELTRLLSAPVGSILDDWRQEGGDDPVADELLLRDALAVVQKHAEDESAWMKWDDFGLPTA